MKLRVTTLTALYFGWLISLHAADTNLPQWDLVALAKAPTVVETQLGKVAGLQSLFIEGLPYKGKPTKFYAYLGFPTNVMGKVPAVVLVHGGGGTALADWVKYWTAKGYAALSLDTEGQIPVRTIPKTPEEKPQWQTIGSLNLGWVGGPQRGAPMMNFNAQLPIAMQDQWLYQAVANSIRSVSLLASRSEVDTHRIGIVGISWGSVICSLVGGIDDRLAFVVPQYIGGNLKLGNVWYDYMKAHPETFDWDPANFYMNKPGKTQWFWISGIDTYGLPPMLTASWRGTGPNSWLTLSPTLGHSHIFGETGKDSVREIYAFADSVTKGTPPLTRIQKTTLEKDWVTLTWAATVPVTHAQLIYTAEPIPVVAIAGEQRKDWKSVHYEVRDLALPKITNLPDKCKQVAFQLPAGMKAGYINLIDSRGLAVSCDFLEPQP